jgi:glutathione reductase (NADPH)
VKVSEFLQSVSNPAVYAAGDCAVTEGPPLTPVGAYEGGVVAANLLEGNDTRVAYPPIPSVVFTVPPLAAVGLQEATAREQGLRFETHYETTSAWYSSKRIGEEYSAYKVLVEEGSGQILGAHLLGSNAEELINLFTMAMRGSMNAKNIKDIIFAYPTYASDMGYMV